MAEEQVKHDHHDGDIIIKDQDGTYKILKDGKFIPLDETEAKEHGLDNEQPKEEAPAMKAETKQEAPVDPMLQKARDQIKASGVTFASADLKNRAEKIMISHYKGVRKPFETKETMLKHPSDGGLGLDDSEALRLLGKSSAEVRPPMNTMPTVAPETHLAKPMPENMPKGSHEIEHPKKLDVKNPPMPKSNEEKPLRPTAVPKPAMADVQKPKMGAVGLVGQLAYTLADWRRVNPNPDDRIKKIENQLGVLEEEAYPERLRGMKAWRDSEVMTMYLDAGKQSIETGKTVQEILGNGGPEALSFAEWSAIAELNKRLR